MAKKGSQVIKIELIGNKVCVRDPFTGARQKCTSISTFARMLKGVAEGKKLLKALEGQKKRKK